MKPASKQKKPQLKYGVGQLILAKEGQNNYVLGMVKSVHANGYHIQWVDDYQDSYEPHEPYYESDVDKFVKILNLFLTDREACDKFEG